MNIFMRQRWIDDRLNFTEYKHDITLNYNMFDLLWVPDLYVKNEKKATFHEVTVPNRLLKLSPNGQIYYSQRFVWCQLFMEFRIVRANSIPHINKTLIWTKLMTIQFQAEFDIEMWYASEVLSNGQSNMQNRIRKL